MLSVFGEKVTGRSIAEVLLHPVCMAFLLVATRGMCSFCNCGQLAPVSPVAVSEFLICHSPHIQYNETSVDVSSLNTDQIVMLFQSILYLSVAM